MASVRSGQSCGLGVTFPTLFLSLDSDLSLQQEGEGREGGGKVGLPT